ncbi:MAG TPA: efflux RND transporter periplasmic adaptor subunit [Gemmatimonadales bacterium]|jgi:RND family efflux transporter MFP subunit
MMQGQWWVVLASLALVSSGCKAKDADTGAAAAEPVVLIGRENLAMAALADLRSGPPISGTLEPKVEARVRSEIMGPVEGTFVDEGQRVRQGVLLARINDNSVRDAYLSARSAVRTAESALQNAQRNAERASRLAKAGALPERDLETAQLNQTNAEGALADARARLAAAQKQLANTEVRSPINGVVSERQVAPGDVVSVGGAMFTIVDLRTLRLEATVPVDEIGRLKVGTPVEFGVSGFDRRFTGRIERINPAVDPATRQVRIYVAIPNAEEALVAGLFAEGRVATDSRRAIAVPISAVDRRGTSPVIHRLKGGKVDLVPVQLGVRDEAAELVEVQSGIAQGDTVLLGSAQAVTEGTAVRVTQEEVSR